MVSIVKLLPHCAHLQTLERELRTSLDYLDTCETTCDVDHLVGACHCCTVHDSTNEPDLVAGLYAGQPNDTAHLG